MNSKPESGLEARDPSGGWRVPHRPMFQITDSPDTLLTILDPIAALVDEARIQIDGNGLRIRAVDPANVALVDERVPSETFDEFVYGEQSGGAGSSDGSNSQTAMTDGGIDIDLSVGDDGSGGTEDTDDEGSEGTAATAQSPDDGATDQTPEQQTGSGTPDGTEESAGTDAEDPDSEAKSNSTTTETATDDTDKSGDASAEGTADSTLVAVEIGPLRKILKHYRSTDGVNRVRLRSTPDQDLVISPVGKDTVSELSMILPGSVREAPEIPNAAVDGGLTIKAQLLKRIDRVSSRIGGDHVELTSPDGEETFSASFDGDMMAHEEVVTADDDTVIEIEPGKIASIFAMEYLSEMIGSIPTGDTVVELELGEDFPMNIDFRLLDGMVPVTFMLAPRIQND